MCAPVPTPEIQAHMAAYFLEKSKANPDPLLLDEYLHRARVAQLRQTTRDRIINAAPRGQMDPALAAILRPQSTHLKGVIQ
ncbi:hypothetical protein [Mesoterricola sediminis]|uniref:Uncharacterized protein n=1 Tax=Mesoterricola sediminis TaxID=2927980 RepID=A0AA48GRI6_9BACT|nr:hypothetical protein [Mesoterricola sediminis]BDU76257.1 hypothetical protein METESE_12150 [Mesoterricola sediminis]